MASPESTTLRIRRKTNSEGYPTYSVQKEQRVESDGRQRSKDNQSVGSLQPVEKAAVRDVRTSHSRTDSRRSHQRSAKPLRSRSSKRKRKKRNQELSINTRRFVMTVAEVDTATVAIVVPKGQQDRKPQDVLVEAGKTRTEAARMPADIQSYPNGSTQNA